MLHHRPFAFLLSAFAGGAFVVFGSTLALSVSAGVSGNLAPGLANLMMGLVFMFSLVIIMFSGMTLVTADMAVGVIGLFHKRISWPSFFLGILAGYVGNFAGSMFFMWLVSKGGSYMSLPWLQQAHMIAVNKTGMTSGEIFVMAIICTWMLQTAALLYIKANEDIAKIFMAAYGPLAFVAGMTEHCIANIGFLALPIFQQDLFESTRNDIIGYYCHSALGIRSVWMGPQPVVYGSWKLHRWNFLCRNCLSACFQSKKSI
jgi:formate/nitrite transporter FocA (FNT family)